MHVNLQDVFLHTENVSHLQNLWMHSNINIDAYIICINSEDPVPSVFSHTASSRFFFFFFFGRLIMIETDRCLWR